MMKELKMGLPEEKNQSNNDDNPSFLEKHPGKVCCLCNLGERSALGQGEFLRLEITGDFSESEVVEDETKSTFETCKTTTSVQGNCRRIKNKCKKEVQSECTNELDKVGHTEVMMLQTLCDGTNFYIHRMCALWSLGSQCNQSEEDPLKNIDIAITKSLKRKCSFCGQFGASVICQEDCSKVFHLPCAVASGSFLVMENFIAYCNDHLNGVTQLANQKNIVCQHCSNLGDISKLTMCSTCGDHYHTTCVGLTNLPDSRSGWNCSNCNKCQICRISDSTEGRSLKCEQCQKLYHASCLRPIISSIPKYGWKCNRCRVCTDCGSRTPGAGTSSRWHCHYTICDSCYQQRNKGFSCPICHKAYRAASYKEMVKCNRCNRFVHSWCDEEADISIYHKKKANNPDYDYLCPNCKTNFQIEKLGLLVDSSEMSSLASVSNDAFIKIENETSGECSKKRLGFKEMYRSRGGKLAVQKGIVAQISRKRSTRGKTRPTSIHNTYNGLVDRYNNDLAKKMLLCSAKDKFILCQDICVMCGSVGLDEEGSLISCVQCGQCYHPYCVNIKLSKTMLQKGWRCLDCTVCEGCGQKNDESRLILCDECDISYHIYCMSPPLDTVPHGHWKCKWCAICQKCGQKSPGKNSTWQNSYLECGPCASQETCFVCSQRYSENDLIIQCRNCERWLHCVCDSINSEEEAHFCDSNDYFCMMCRPKGKSFVNFLMLKKSAKDSLSSNSSMLNSSINGSSGSKLGTGVNLLGNELIDSYETSHWIDGVCVSERGLNIIKALTTEIKRKRKLKPPGDVQNKDSGIMAAIESVVSGNVLEDGGDEGMAAKKPLECYKDGMIWAGADSTRPPEGFSISTNEEGVNVLRKKRQRNLQKLGIGGFSVRNRTLKKDIEENLLDQSVSLSSEKKKKIIRKKMKTKLIETYPSYLQEAFFGKELLSSDRVKLSLSESDTSDEFQHDISQESNSKMQEPCQPTTSTILPEKNISKIDVQNTEVLVTSIPADTTSMKLDENTESLPEKLNIIERSEEGIEPIQPQPTKISIGQTFVNLPLNSPVLSGLTTQAPEVNKVANEYELLGGMCPSLRQYKPVLDTHFINPMPHNVQSKMQHRTPTETVSLQSADDFVSKPIAKIPLQIQQDQKKLICKQGTTDALVIAKSSEDTIESIVAGTQKTAEKMRRDEDLGEMATISAVLYSNTQHPELKQAFPNWTDRCKQILKRWRSLPTERKAPFLQIAKDNRSALRMRRAQQDQEKITFQQKTLKEQEQERIWKQHQAKAKEIQNTTLYTNNEILSIDPGTKQIDNTNRFLIYSRNISENQNDAAGYKSPKTLKRTSPLVRSTSQRASIVENHLDADNKQLRTLLLKQGTQWIPESAVPLNSPYPVPQCETYKANILSETATVNDNEMDEFKQIISNDNKTIANPQSMQAVSQDQLMLKQDLKNRFDVKLGESTDATAELEKFDQYENAGIGDILGGLAEGDDDDLLKSLTAEIGDDFNILEYADPELDEITTNQNLLNKLDFVDNEKQN